MRRVPFFGASLDCAMLSRAKAMILMLIRIANRTGDSLCMFPSVWQVRNLFAPSRLTSLSSIIIEYNDQQYWMHRNFGDDNYSFNQEVVNDFFGLL
jgi:hypothetical protein